MPLFVDLDGTLTKSDLFVESIIKLIKSNPLNVFRLLFWLLRGRAAAKTMVARRTKIDVSALPYNGDLIAHLERARESGRRLTLITAAHWTHARQVAAHLGLFDDAYGSSARFNLKGQKKLERIQAIAGDAPWAYAGDSPADRPIWRAAAGAVFVDAPQADIEEARSGNKVERVFVSQSSVPAAFVRGIRLHQWSKNLLIFIPLFTSHSYGQLQPIVAGLLAFLCFGLCAAGVYLLNDLLDLDADRRHATKKQRPLASGDLRIRLGVIGSAALPLTAFLFALLTLPGSFAAVLLVYYITTNAYSFRLKRASTIDVITLSVLYTLRVLAGAVAIGVAISSWLLAFSIFFFLSLAYLKRFCEAIELDAAAANAPGRGYSAADKETMFGLGVANGSASVLVLALYVHDATIRSQYANADILWLLCLVLLYWINRIWVGARRGKVDQDPIVFALRDNVSRVVLLLCLAVFIAAKYLEI